MSSRSAKFEGRSSKLLAELLADVRYDDLPADVIDHARRAVIDWLGSALAGSMEGPARLAQSVAAVKQAVYQSGASDLDEMMRYETEAQLRCFESEDGHEGVRAFFEKRDPRFTGH